MEIIQEICKEGKSKKKEQKICLLSKITNIEEKKKKQKQNQKTKNKKNTSISLPPSVYMRQSAMEFQIMPLHLLRHNPKIPIKGKTVRNGATLRLGWSWPPSSEFFFFNI